MSTKEEKTKRVIVEPVFEESMPGIMVAPPDPGDEPMGIPFTPEIPCGAFPAAHSKPSAEKPEAAGVTWPWCHVPPRIVDDLKDEINHYNQKARDLLYFSYLRAFSLNDVGAQLTVPGVWEVGEEAEYKITVRNRTDFDLKSMRVYLWASPGDLVKIIRPPGNFISIGDIDYNCSKSATFKVKGEKRGRVTLKVRIDGYMGCMKRRLYYDGNTFLNAPGLCWWIRPSYRMSYDLY